MRVRRRDVLKVATSTAAAAVATKLAGRSARASTPTRIVRDVCVIGGGSAGTYAAIQLRNLGKSVVVLEKENRLGGHAETVFVNNLPINIGVQIFEGQNPLVTSYCSQLNVPLVPVSLSGGPPAANVDFRTGTPVTIPPTDPVALGTAIGTYLQVLQTQFPYLDSGFNLPNPVPPDLLIPFGDFVTKYGLDALVPTAFLFTQGAGNLLANPAIYILKAFGLSVVGALATDSFVAIPTGTSALYEAATAFLGNDAILNAQVAAVVRGGSHVEVFAETPDGPVFVEADKLVFAIPPTLPNLSVLVPDALEAALFSRFESTYYATSLVQFSGLPPGVSVNNVAANTRDNLPPLPGMYGINANRGPWLLRRLAREHDVVPRRRGEGRDRALSKERGFLGPVPWDEVRRHRRVQQPRSVSHDGFGPRRRGGLLLEGERSAGTQPNVLYGRRVPNERLVAHLDFYPGAIAPDRRVAREDFVSRRAARSTGDGAGAQGGDGPAGGALLCICAHASSCFLCRDRLGRFLCIRVRIAHGALRRAWRRR